MLETSPSKPIFFRHLPKTAGTSLITTLANVFGDEGCHRFGELAEDFGETFSKVIADEGKPRALVCGHVPLSLLAEGVCGTEFTVLREPIARLLSMRRFFDGLPVEERTRLGFGDRVTVTDLLASQDRENYSNVRNNLTRFYCGSAAYADPGTREFWERDPAPAAIEACMESLERMAVGIVEDMPATLRRLGHVLRVPYDLEIPVENATSEFDDEVSPHDIAALAAVNTADIAVYELIRKRLSRWSPSLGHVTGSDFDPRTLFDPQPGEAYGPRHIAGRQGFTACPPSYSMSWLGPTGKGRIHLAPSKRPLTLSFFLYGVVPHYPMDDVAFTLDGRPWSRAHRRGDGHSVFDLAPIPPHAGPAELAIMQPCAVPVPIVHPDSPDTRNLGVALSKVLCEAG